MLGNGNQGNQATATCSYAMLLDQPFKHLDYLLIDPLITGNEKRRSGRWSPHPLKHPILIDGLPSGLSKVNALPRRLRFFLPTSTSATYNKPKFYKEFPGNI